ncbi:MAG: polysaccharide biosynthesis protein [Christensenellales bacterium]
MSDKQKSFVKGAAILGAAGLAVKVIGAFFRVPLTNIIGAEGLANYQVAYPTYALLLVISSAGLPAAISRIVSERVTLGDYRGAHRTFQTAFRMLLVFGVITTSLMFSFSDIIAGASKIPSAHLSLKMIAPSLFFVSVLSAYRGYFQGLQMMFPTALTQIVEQAVKLGAGIYLASLWVGKGVEYGAAGALLGVTISEILALVVIIFIYNRKKRQISKLRRQSPGLMHRPKRSSAFELVSIAVPITLGACVMPIVNFIDTAIVTNTLSAIDYSAFNPLSPTASFGVLTGAVNTLVNMPAVLSLALCMSLVPAISEARAKNDDIALSSRSGMGFKLALLIGLPCSVGLYLLAEPVITLLYSRGLNANEIAVGAQLLKTLSVGVLFLTMLQSMTGVLQGAGLQWVPFFSLLIGAGVKLAVSLVLIKIPSVNVNGAAIGTAACYGIAALINTIVVLARTRARVRIASGLLTPLLSAAVMGVVVHFMYRSLLPELGGAYTVIACIATAVLVYVAMLFFTGALKKNDMAFIPGGGRITRFINKLGFWES